MLWVYVAPADTTESPSLARMDSSEMVFPAPMLKVTVDAVIVPSGATELLGVTTGVTPVPEKPGLHEAKS
jgi:hypothetical protein